MALAMPTRQGLFPMYSTQKTHLKPMHATGEDDELTCPIPGLYRQASRSFFNCNVSVNWPCKVCPSSKDICKHFNRSEISCLGPKATLITRSHPVNERVGASMGTDIIRKAWCESISDGNLSDDATQKPIPWVPDNIIISHFESIETEVEVARGVTCRLSRDAYSKRIERGVLLGMWYTLLYASISRLQFGYSSITLASSRLSGRLSARGHRTLGQKDST